jgi:hypothetical protein
VARGEAGSEPVTVLVPERAGAEPNAGVGLVG